jgi:hypothetical protein
MTESPSNGPAAADEPSIPADGPAETGPAEPTEPIEIKPLSDEDIRDALPEDLDAAGYVGPYLFPNNNRRRIPGIIYLVLAAGCLVLWATTRSGAQILVNGGFLAAAIGLALVGIYSIIAGWNLAVDERDALVEAVRTVGFPVGHASAQMGWRGLLSRPTWRILLYSAEDPPSQRGLVLVDGVHGDVLEWFVEENPEDWSQFDD